MGCDLREEYLPTLPSVSIHAPAWGATDDDGRLIAAGDGVSIHAPAWGATVTLLHLRTKRMCFNPRTRMGCDKADTSKADTSKVSIHAPAWGATDGTETASELSIVSIHAPAWGATSHCRLYEKSNCFNPRTRMGCDRFDYADGDPDKVSIHAPAWGATYCIASCRPAQLFQSTHPHGVRLAYSSSIDKATLFQSTHPHGVRRLKQKSNWNKIRFQSTHPHRVRLRDAIRNPATLVSIHAPA